MDKSDVDSRLFELTRKIAREGRADVTLENYERCEQLTGQDRDRANSIYDRWGRPFRTLGQIYIFNAGPLATLLVCGNGAIKAVYTASRAFWTVSIIYILSTIVFIAIERQVKALYLLAVRSPTLILARTLIKEIHRWPESLEKIRLEESYAPRILALTELFRDYRTVELSAKQLTDIRWIVNSIDSVLNPTEVELTCRCVLVEYLKGRATE